MDYHPRFYLFCISIHAPRGGSDLKPHPACAAFNLFLSTLPVGGATPLSGQPMSRTKNFYPRSPWGERQQCGGDTAHEYIYFYPRSPWGERRFVFPGPVFQVDFYPRSPWGERLYVILGTMITDEYFYPRSPWGERRLRHRVLTPAEKISIHAPRGGSDSKHDNIPFIFATVYYAI